MGTFDLEKSEWITKCPNRKERIECLHCGCGNKVVSDKKEK